MQKGVMNSGETDEGRRGSNSGKDTDRGRDYNDRDRDKNDRHHQMMMMMIKNDRDRNKNDRNRDNNDRNRDNNDRNRDNNDRGRYNNHHRGRDNYDNRNGNNRDRPQWNWKIAFSWIKSLNLRKVLIDYLWDFIFIALDYNLECEIVLFSWNGILQSANKFDAHLCRRIAFDLILNEPALHLQLHHFQCTANASVDDAIVSEIREIRWKFDEFRQRIVVEYKREFVAWCSPVCDCRLDVEIHSAGMKYFIVTIKPNHHK